MTDPMAKFRSWLGQAESHKGIAEPTAMCLATAAADGQPSARIVLLKGADERGFVFYTNLESRKSRELRQNPKAALCFFWEALHRQVRVEGRIEPVDAADADLYFATRPRDSQIGAWSSKQSAPLESREALLKAVAATHAKFKSGDVPRPDFWSGWRVVPEVIEFWEQGEHRLHERDVYMKTGHGWDIRKLYP